MPSHPLVPPLPPPARAPQLKRSLEDLLALPGARKPTAVRFFRGQMQTIISRALSELDITPLPSRRCFALMSEWSWVARAEWSQGGAFHCVCVHMVLLPPQPDDSTLMTFITASHPPHLASPPAPPPHRNRLAGGPHR